MPGVEERCNFGLNWSKQYFERTKQFRQKILEKIICCKRNPYIIMNICLSCSNQNQTLNLNQNCGCFNLAWFLSVITSISEKRTVSTENKHVKTVNRSPLYGGDGIVVVVVVVSGVNAREDRERIASHMWKKHEKQQVRWTVYGRTAHQGKVQQQQQ